MSEYDSRAEREAKGYEAASFYKNLGNQAVEARIDQHQTEAQLENIDPADQEARRQLEDLVESDRGEEEAFISQAREKLKSLDEFDAQTFYMNEGKHLPPIIKSWIGLGESIPDFNEITVPDRLVALNDEQFLNYLQWHNNRYAEMQKRLEADIPEYNQRFVERVTGAAEEGWLPAIAVDRLKRLGSRKINVYDRFYEDGQDANARITYHSIEVKASLLESEEGPESSLSHENVHLISENESGRTGVAFDESYKWINEALTEHINSTLQYGGVDLIDPSQRNEQLNAAGGSYSEYRLRLAALVEKQGSESLQRLIDAYFEEDKVKARQTVESILGGE